MYDHYVVWFGPNWQNQRGTIMDSTLHAANASLVDDASVVVDPIAFDQQSAPGRISPQHGALLFSLLATDDDFRSRYERDPAGCLRAIGVPESTLAFLWPKCLLPRALAPKSAYTALLEHMDSEAYAAAMEFQSPKVG